MKKIAYNAPEMEVVDLKLQGMLCMSDGGGSSSDPNNPKDGDDLGEIEM